MCGICAVITLQGSPAPTEQENVALRRQLSNSLDVIQHRGPDARGEWASADGRVHLGHVRLSIIDLSPAANQPFHDDQDDVHAVVNGELYDYEDYRDLLGDEYDFKSHSDCEAVLALYRHYGLSFLSYLRGEFALVLWDARRKVLIAARDRFGVKSLYYTVINNRLIVATEMKCFKAFGWEPEWDVQSFREYSWTYGSGTFFKGVKTVQPGHYIISRSFRNIEDSVFWDAEYPDKSTVDHRSEAEMIAGVRARLMEAIRLRLRADVPLGIYLSGGIDSSAVAGMVVHLVKEEGARLGNDDSQILSRIKCFTVQFNKDSGADESDIAQRTAEWLGVDFHPVPIDENAVVARFEDLVWHSEIPLPDINGIGRLAMAETAKAYGIKVILTGEGSDEHFGGYADLTREYFLEPDPSWPSGMLSDAERKEALQVLQGNSGTAGVDFTERKLPESARRMLNNTTMFSRTLLLGALPFAQWTNAYTATAPETGIMESLDGRTRYAIANRWHPLHAAEYIWTTGVFRTFLLRYLGDNVDMVHHVETRPPFLDHHLTEYANSLPPSVKIKYSPTDKTVVEKHVLREAVRPFVTDEIYKRRKKPYVGPTLFQENGPLHQLIDRLTSQENIEALGFVDWQRTKEHVHEAFVEKNGIALRYAMIAAQLVVLSQRFGVKRAI
ncbi:asparagine synthetase [Aspergillus terreus]|uniref:Asparagine synthetase n=1 Tax=Aspergillus terreus TaxID=33178 RepID=A0A5M3Z173_ASPTE|nr:hypothetical protein ATETN484_0007044500 [Aspergillus terreus]GFF16250.1 asparagine synthetase [Aspergillus terreus]